MFKEGSESYEQAVVVQYLKLHGYKHTMINNDMWTPSFNQKRKQKLLGMNPGMSDMIIKLNTKDALLFLEMKKKKGPNGGMNGSVVSEFQEQWRETINTVPGCEYFIAHGSIEAIERIEALESI